MEKESMTKRPDEPKVTDKNPGALSIIVPEPEASMLRELVAMSNMHIDMLESIGKIPTEYTAEELKRLNEPVELVRAIIRFSYSVQMNRVKGEQ